MVRISIQLVVSLAISVSVMAIPSNSKSQAEVSISSPDVPSRDPFYIVPGDVGKYDPGTIIKFRRTPSPIGGFGESLSHLSESWQIQYRTTDNVGKATTTVLTVLIPLKPDYDKLLSFQVAENDCAIDCAPSWGFQLVSKKDPRLSSSTTQLQALLADAALAKGWVVIVPDMWGPKGAYLAHKLAGRAILDGVRAAIRSGSFTGISKHPRTALWGYSIAAPPTQWAVEIQPSYAGELNIAGAAIGGGSANVEGSLLNLNGGRTSGFIPLALIGLSSQYPELGNLTNAHLRPQYRAEFYKAQSQCLEANLRTYGQVDVAAMFDNFNDVLKSPILAKVVADNSHDRQRTIPRIPLFWYQCVGDAVSPIAQVDDMLHSWCDNRGVSIEYERNVAPKPNHTTCGILSAPHALNWLETIMNGRNPSPGCFTQSVYTTIVDRDFLKVFPPRIAYAIAHAV